MTVTDEGNELLQKIVGQVFGNLCDAVPDGKRWVSLPGGHTAELSDSQRSYRYYRHEGRMFCYTPWKDTEGWYWAWDYKPIGKGARTGNPSRWKGINPVKFRTRKKAMKRAEDRYSKFSNKKAL